VLFTAERREQASPADGDDKERAAHLRGCTDAAAQAKWRRRQAKKAAPLEARAEAAAADEEVQNAAAWALLGSTAQSAWCVAVPSHGAASLGVLTLPLARVGFSPTSSSTLRVASAACARAAGVRRSWRASLPRRPAKQALRRTCLRRARLPICTR